MKIICTDNIKLLCPINTSSVLSLTIGKWYQVIEEDEDCYIILDDCGDESFHLKHLFKTQQEVREEKLKEIGL